ncbi:hypothetical protein ES711_03265 [Gelidibacter salicanalis]|uniref:Lipoprotein n=1 Tax=Gelidibacter salicanalis TaxID=291193 RepID=A0A5C7AK24_9FLAO|nr:hypothetical protein [Gelidibacter salicanalis]TXE08968.1 hypothetical protein ES711_03265 [Gelidibacter salicanalis]
MKKINSLTWFFLILLSSCNKDEKSLFIEDFTVSKEIVLEPYKNYPYSMMNVWIKGYSNDTILIKLHSQDSEPILRLSGDIDERWYTDYYDEGNRIIIFEPYKATNGKIEIKTKL